MKNQTVYLVFQNRDMTEGRGPMILKRCFYSLELAKFFLSDKCGIMGCDIGNGTQYDDGVISYNGAWEIRPIEVETTVLDKEQLEKLKKKKAAIEEELVKINRLLT